MGPPPVLTSEDALKATSAVRRRAPIASIAPNFARAVHLSATEPIPSGGLRGNDEVFAPKRARLSPTGGEDRNFFP